MLDNWLDRLRCRLQLPARFSANFSPPRFLDRRDPERKVCENFAGETLWNISKSLARITACNVQLSYINHGKHFYKSKRIEEIKLSSMHQVCWRLRKLRKLRWLIRDTSIFPSQLTNLRSQGSQVSKLQSQVSKLRRKNQGVPYEQPYSRQWLRAIYGRSKSLQAFIQSR